MPQPAAASDDARPLAPFECRVWWATIADGGPHIEPLLSAPEREREAAYLQSHDRLRFAIGACLLRRTAAGCLAVAPDELRVDRRCERCGAQHGKPRLPDHPELDVSVAHSGEHVVVALAHGPRVGVDVEQVRDVDVAEFSAAAFSFDEAAELAALPEDERNVAFFALWTRKESIVKALAVGITDDFADASERTAGTAVHKLPCAPGYVSALAIIGRCDHIAQFDGAALLRT